MQLKSGFNKKPFIDVKGGEDACSEGWASIGSVLIGDPALKGKGRKILAVEVYQGILYDEVLVKLRGLLQPALLIDTAGLFLPEEDIRRRTWPDVTDDRVFGYMTRLNMADFLDAEGMKSAEEAMESVEDGLVLVFGYGASLLVPEPDLLIYADMARWEIQLRMRKNLVNNLGISNREELPELKYKRAFFVDWRVCDRLKKKTMAKWDYVLDTNDNHHPRLARAEAVREGLRQAVRQPFSVVPFFDPGPWGGQWMKANFDLEKEVTNFAWCFNCVPEENSLYLKFGEMLFEIPSVDLVFYLPAALLGDPVHARFGDEFPIRFDFLDTMDGGNLSLQVHPLTEYIQEKFGMHYTQDESYYILEAESDGSVYLGLKEGADRAAMERELRRAEKEGVAFDPEHYVANWPAKKHDHFLIPGGTIHCSGKNSMVLEISATPYIFTFKLYDWGRKNLDGKPRPINVDHGLANIQWERTEKWTKSNLIDRVEKLAEGEGWIEERTGLHEREFIETRRHWFTGTVPHDTDNGVNVLNLVEGEQVIVESPDNSFEPFVVNYAETFIVPAAVGRYTIRPFGKAEGKRCATIKAYVRKNA
ncbi:MAG: class I mannose-6-phosphate isomerase [Bacteroidota bacterium]